MRTPADVVAALSRGPENLRALLADVPPRDLKRRPRPAKWSAHEHACHLALMEPHWLARVERMIGEDVPTIINYDPDGDEPPDRLLTLDLSQCLDDYERGRSALLKRLETLSVDDWNRGAVHTGHTRYSLFLMCRHAALHDMFHVYRVEESVLGTNWPSDRIP